MNAASDRLIRTLALAAVLIVAAIAAVVSFLHIQHLAITHGQTTVGATLLPVSVDGTVAAASLVMLRAARNALPTPWLARTMLAMGVAGTLAANVGYGLPFGVTGALISGWPALAFVGSVEMTLAMIRVSQSTNTARQHATSGVAPPRGDRSVDLDNAREDVERVEEPARRHVRVSQAMTVRARDLLARQPSLAGAELGRHIGVSARTGQRLRTRLLEEIADAYRERRAAG